MKFVVEAVSEKGAYRPNNEDAIRYAIDNERQAFWLAIADGMGGHKAGEVASAIFVSHAEQCLTDWLQSITPGSEQESVTPDYCQLLEQTLVEANRLIFKAAKEEASYRGMGTTGVLLLGLGSRLYIAWVGDSRVYLFHKQRLNQLTQDHSMIQYLLDKGAISMAEARRSNSRHLLARAIGVKYDVEVDSVEQTLAADDLLLASTDGLHDFLDENMLAGFLSQAHAGAPVAVKMIKQALAQGSRDNLSLGIIRVGSLS